MHYELNILIVLCHLYKFIKTQIIFNVTENISHENKKFLFLVNSISYFKLKLKK